jgi:hypothetical protein
LHPFRFACPGPARHQPIHREQAAVHRFGNEFFGHRPLEQPLDPPEPLVDDPAADVRVDQVLPECLQLQWREFRSGELPEQLPQRAERKLEIALLAGRGAIRVAVVDGDVSLPELKNQFCNSDRRGVGDVVISGEKGSAFLFEKGSAWLS